MTEQLITQSQIKARINSLAYMNNIVNKCLNFYQGDQLSYMQKQWRKKVSPAEFTLIKDKIEQFPFTSQIVDELSIIFQNGLKYKINGDDKEQTQKIIQLIKQSNLLSKLDYVNKMVTLLSASAILIEQDNQGDINLQILTPDKYFTQSDNYGKVTAFWYEQFKSYSLNKANRFNIYTRITNEYIQTVELKQGNYVIIEQEQNKLGIIPAVIFTQNLINELQVNPNLCLIQQNIQLNNLYTQVNQLVFMQSFSTLVITNAEQTQKPILYGINKVLLLNAPQSMSQTKPSTDAKFISPNARITQVDSLINNRMQKYAASLGIGSSAFKNETVSSGYQLKLSKQDIINKAIKKLPIYQNKLDELVSYIIAIHNYYNETQLLDQNQIKLIIKEPSYDISQNEKQELNKLRLQNRTTSPVRLLMEQNQITYDQAIILYKQIMQQNAMTSQTVVLN